MGFVVDGIDVSTMGARFHGLYLPPPSRPDKPLAVKTLIVPTQEYSEGRSVMLTTGRSVYTVALAPPGRAARRLELVRHPDRRKEEPHIADGKSGSAALQESRAGCPVRRGRRQQETAGRCRKGVLT